jgi:hypothetical protein
MGSSLGSAHVTLEFLVSLNDGSVYPKFQRSTHAILPPMRIRGECGCLVGNVTAQKEKAHSACLQLVGLNEKSSPVPNADRAPRLRGFFCAPQQVCEASAKTPNPTEARLT